MMMTEPLLGLDFDPVKVHFESAPSEITRALHLRDGQYWIFSTYDDRAQGNCRYIIIAGLTPVYLDTDPPQKGPLESDFGSVIAHCGKGYKSLGVPDRLVSDLGLPDRVVLGLVRNSIERLICAHGGKTSLQKVLSQQLHNREILPKLVLEVLRESGIKV